MKELSIEEKAKRYDEAVKVAKSNYETIVQMDNDCTFAKEGIVNTFHHMFPELKDSENEKIRKALIYHYQGDGCLCTNEYRIDYKEIRAWLEKQGKQKPYGQRQECTDCQFNYAGECKGSCQMKREEQEANKAEPKFKVGDWVVSDKNNVIQIKAVNNGYYTIDNGMDFNIPYVDKYWHLWTIRDAKEGDVLSYVTDEEDLWIMIYWSLYEPYEGHVHYHALLVNDNFSDKGTCCICIDNLKPATKEQSELLFAKMKESGYEWNSEKKELEKIIDEKQIKKNLQDNSFRKMFEQKPAWSEKDLEMLSGIESDLSMLMAKNPDYEFKKLYQEEIDWLKSLKPKLQRY